MLDVGFLFFKLVNVLYILEPIHHPVASLLGTFITEWEAGSAVCKDLLASEMTVETTVNQLTRIALYYGFEGWLVNIENEVPPAKVSGDFLHFS